MRYFDTSFLVPLVLEEPTSNRIEQFLRRQDGELAISHWTRTEFSSLLAREVRMGSLAPGPAREADDQLEAVVSESFNVLSPVPRDFDLAKRFLQSFGTGLRAGDALHLAIASNHGAETIYTLDKTMLGAGKALGLAIRTGIRVG